MKIFLGTAILSTIVGPTVAAANDSASSDPRLLIECDFLSSDQVSELASAPLDDSHSGSRYFGQALLDREIALRLPREHSIPVWVNEETGDVPILTTLITQTSERHSDVHVNAQAENEIPFDEVERNAFVFLNDNEYAYFSWGEIKIPVRAGCLVAFPGSVEHQTVIQDGHVHLAGPFTLGAPVEVETADITSTSTATKRSLRGRRMLFDGNKEGMDVGTSISDAPTEIPPMTVGAGRLLAENATIDHDDRIVLQARSNALRSLKKLQTRKEVLA